MVAAEAAETHPFGGLYRPTHLLVAAPPKLGCGFLSRVTNAVNKLMLCDVTDHLLKGALLAGGGELQHLLGYFRIVDFATEAGPSHKFEYGRI